jgi:hypothetical protein
MPMMEKTAIRFPGKNALSTSVAAILLVIGMLAASEAQAVLSVYQSTNDNGLDSGPAQIHGHSLVHVYFNNGSSPPTPAANACTSSGADEICQWAVRFETTGDLKIIDVAWGGIIEDDPPTRPRRSSTARAATPARGRREQAGDRLGLSGTTGEPGPYTPTASASSTRTGLLSRWAPPAC